MKNKRIRRAGIRRGTCPRRPSQRPAPRAGKLTVVAPPEITVARTLAPSAVPPVESYAHGTGSAFHLYVREIGQTPLLTPKEEIQLARRIHKGDEAAREH